VATTFPISSHQNRESKILGGSSQRHQQSHGLQQISRAVAGMEVVTQKNAGAAEETASTSEELNAEAASLKNVVECLQD
jgi:methyl-accepting chemotaxis protein